MRIVSILVALVFAAAFPIDMLFLGWALKKLVAEFPWWVSAIVAVAIILSAFGLTALVDSRERQAKSSQL